MKQYYSELNNREKAKVFTSINQYKAKTTRAAIYRFASWLDHTEVYPQIGFIERMEEEKEFPPDWVIDGVSSG